MGPLLVLIFPCFWGNCNCHMQNSVFLCSLNNFLLKNVGPNCFLFWKSQFKNRALIWKRAIVDLLFIFLVMQPKDTKIPSAHISLTYTYFAHHWHFFFFFASPIWQKLRIYHVWFPFGAIPGVDSYSRHLGAIKKTNKQTKWWAKFKLESLLLIFIYTNAKFIVICKPQTLNDSRWRHSSIQKTQKALLASSSHFVFYQ